MKLHEKSDASGGNAAARSASTDAAQEGVTPATDQEIERARAKWAKKQRAEHGNFVKQFSFHTSTTFMDYLHGDVKDEEAWLACLYEYARESKSLREAANRRDELKEKEKGLDTKKAAEWALQDLKQQPRFLIEILTFLECESFPKKDWPELSQQDRNKIIRFHPTKKIPPLFMPDVWTLKAMGILEKFKVMGENAKPVVEDHDPQRGKFAQPYKPVPALLQQHKSFYHAIFTLDFSEGETQLVNRFREWLRLPENQERLAKYRKTTTGTTGKPLDRLKDLAAWRLYRELGNNWNKANEFADKHRKRFTAQKIREWFKTEEERGNYRNGDPMPFRDAKSKKEKWESGQQVIIPANEADLFGEDADAREAQASAWKHLAELMPQEFDPPGPHMFAMFIELEKSLASKG